MCKGMCRRSQMSVKLQSLELSWSDRIIALQDWMAYYLGLCNS